MSESTPSQNSTAANDASTVARAYLDSFATGDPDIIAEHVAEDFVNEHTAALGSGCIGKAAYRTRLPEFLRDMADLRYEIEHLTTEDDEVAAFYTMTAQWLGASPISVRGVQRLRISNGLVIHRTDYWDSAAFLTQVSHEAREALKPFGI